MIPLDTSPAARKIQTDIIRNMTPAERLKIALELSELARQLAFARISAESPGLPENEVIRIFVRSVLRLEAIAPA